jgi:hypothetical protein
MGEDPGGPYCRVREGGGRVRAVTVSLYNSKIFISGSCLILVLTTVRVAHVVLMLKKLLKTIRGQLLPDKMRFENT